MGGRGVFWEERGIVWVKAVGGRGDRRKMSLFGVKVSDR